LIGRCLNPIFCFSQTSGAADFKKEGNGCSDLGLCEIALSSKSEVLYCFSVISGNTPVIQEQNGGMVPAALVILVSRQFEISRCL
jgi:hypothetical protein